MSDTAVLLTICAGLSAAWLLFMAAMAGRMNQLEKSYKAKLRYDHRMADIESLKANKQTGGVEAV